VSPDREGTLRQVEEFFLRSGVPHLSARYDAREDTLTRARTSLLVLMVLGITLAVRPDWPFWARLTAAVAGVVAILGLIALINILRGRPPLVRPERVSFLEAGAIVLAPAAIDLAIGDRPLRAAVVAVVSVVAAALFYALTSLGVVAMFLGLGRRLLQGLADTGSIALRAMPPMLAVLLFLFLATEVWQAFGLVEGWRFGGILVLFALLSALFLLTGLRKERDAFRSPDPARLRERAGHTPAAPLVAAGVVPATPPLSRIARLNVVAALLASLGARVIAVGVAIAAFFVVFGLLAVDRALTAEWTGEASPNVLLAVSISGREVVLSEALVRVSLLLGGFAALYFSVVAISEQRNREEFLEDEIERISRVMAAWAYYRGALPDAVAPRPLPAPGVREGG
jgi:hypothetical protein